VVQRSDGACFSWCVVPMVLHVPAQFVICTAHDSSFRDEETVAHREPNIYPRGGRFTGPNE
jgi:hypothetical protein